MKQVPTAYAQAEIKGGLIPTGTPGNYTNSDVKTVKFTDQFIESLNQSGRELDEAIARVTGKK